jgi:hypothetical protein
MSATRVTTAGKLSMGRLGALRALGPDPEIRIIWTDGSFQVVIPATPAKWPARSSGQGKGKENGGVRVTLGDK